MGNILYQEQTRYSKMFLNTGVEILKLNNMAQKIISNPSDKQLIKLPKFMKDAHIDDEQSLNYDWRDSHNKLTSKKK